MSIAARIFGLLLLIQSVAVPAVAQSPGESALRAVITRQLDAMNQGDYAAAFAIASPAIQQLFQDAPRFKAMIERGYPQVAHSRSHRFLGLNSDTGRLIQRVFIDSEAGTVVGSYEMLEIDGQWRINGVIYEKSEGT